MEDKDNTIFKHAIKVLSSGMHRYDHIRHQEKGKNRQRNIPWPSKSVQKPLN